MQNGAAINGRDGGTVRPAPVPGYRFYWQTWFILLVLTALEVMAVMARLRPRLLLAVLLALTAAKMGYIAFNFMHLRFERLGLILIFVLPFVFGVMMYLGTAPDFGLFVGPTP